jgi:uncharacterized protein YbbK (DUF523 family)
MWRVLVSGRLGGATIRFHETGVLVDSPIWRQWKAEGRLVSVCPELAVGFPVPRPPAEIVDGTAAEVFDGHGRVLEASGRDVTELFRAAAHRAVQRALDAHVALAVLVDGGPTCGSSYAHDGTFSGAVTPGRGVAAEALQRHGIPVFDQHQLVQAAAALAELEHRSG